MIESKTVSGLPYGVGSIKIRKANYWIVYRDLEGRRIQANTHTLDRAEAVRRLAEAALPAARARVALLEQVASGKKEATEAGRETAQGKDARRGGYAGSAPERRGFVRATVEDRRAAARRKGGRN
jgi:hypothetical protein